MPKFLFWNIGNKKLLDLVREAVREHNPDILILAESPYEFTEVLLGVNSAESTYKFASQRTSVAQVFTTFNPEFYKIITDEWRISVARLTLPLQEEVLICVVHLRSRMWNTPENQSEACIRLAKVIRQHEEKVGHDRTLVLGDFNVNPFERGVVSAEGLHAVMSRTVAKRESRIVEDEQYKFFYNPMWNHFGDNAPAAPGTYYYDKSGYITFFWNIFDQVIVRPKLIDGLRDDGVKIISSIGSRSLLNRSGAPDTTNASDHLPLLVDITL